MRWIGLISILILAINAVAAQGPADAPFRYKAKMGFTKSEDKIEKYKFVDDGRKLVIVGKKNLQLWDVENLKQLSSLSYDTYEFSRAGKIETLVSLGIRLMVRWGSIEIDPAGKWFAAIEEMKDVKRAVIRDLRTGKLVGELDLGDFKINEISLSDRNIIVYGKKGDSTKFGVWDTVSLRPKSSFLVEDHKWHQELANSDRLLIGSGEQRLNWVEAAIRQGSGLQLWNLATGTMEREFVVPDPVRKDDYFFETRLTGDERHFISKRDKRIFVWETDGNGVPKIEVAAAGPKASAELVKIIDDRYLVASVDKGLRIYDIGGDGRPRYDFASPDPQKSVVFGSATKDGRFFAIYTGDKVQFYETAGSGQPLSEITPPERPYTRVRMTDDGNYFIVSPYPKKKEPARSLFYNIRTGRMEFEVPFSVGDEIIFTPDRKYLLTETIGSLSIWNFQENRASTVKLETVTNTCEYGDSQCVEETKNYERTKILADRKLIVKHSPTNISIIDFETGQDLQQIFDADKVEYDKQNKIKYTGISALEFLPDEKYLLGIDSPVYNYENAAPDDWRHCYNCRTISVWELGGKK